MAVHLDRIGRSAGLFLKDASNGNGAKMILKPRSIIFLSVVLGLDLAACSKHLSGRYVCRQDVFRIQARRNVYDV